MSGVLWRPAHRTGYNAHIGQRVYSLTYGTDEPSPEPYHGWVLREALDEHARLVTHIPGPEHQPPFTAATAAIARDAI